MPKRRPRVFDKTKSPSENLVGKHFGKLTVVEWAGKSEIGTKGDKRDFWICECDCKDPLYTPLTVEVASLTSGNTKSCGCKSRKHMQSNHPLYWRWLNMIRRCYDSNDAAYKRYGARGITVCDRWRENFVNFHTDMGEPPTENHSIDRINNDLGYSPENCRWATPKEQGRNTRNNRQLNWQGETKTIAGWAEDPRLVEIGVEDFLISSRLRLGWDVERIFTTPPTIGNLITFRDETLSMMDWSRRMGARVNVVSMRVKRGWSIEEALTIPLGKRRNPV